MEGWDRFGLGGLSPLEIWSMAFTEQNDKRKKVKSKRGSIGEKNHPGGDSVRLGGKAAIPTVVAIAVRSRAVVVAVKAITVDIGGDIALEGVGEVGDGHHHQIHCHLRPTDVLRKKREINVTVGMVGSMMVRTVTLTLPQHCREGPRSV